MTRDPFERLRRGECWDCGLALEVEPDACRMRCPECGKEFTGFEMALVTISYADGDQSLGREQLGV